MISLSKFGATAELARMRGVADGLLTTGFIGNWEVS